MSIITATQLQHEQLRDAAAVVDTLSQELSQGTRRYSADWYVDVDTAMVELAGVLSDIFDLPGVSGTGSVRDAPRYMLESLRDTSRRTHIGVQPFAQGDRSRFQPGYLDALDATCLECYATIQDIRGQFSLRWSGLPVYTDTEGTTEATWGDPVGLIKDTSGNGNDFTQPTVTARPILRNDPPRLEFDLTDDNLTATLPAIENGTVVIAGTGGIWIDDDYNFDGGTFSIGPTTYTNGPEGILTAIGDPIERGFLVINRQLGRRERELMIQEMKERGAPGVFELGPELYPEGRFEDGIDNIGGVSRGTAEWSDGALKLVTTEVSLTQYGVVATTLNLSSLQSDVPRFVEVAYTSDVANTAQAIRVNRSSNPNAGIIQSGSFAAGSGRSYMIVPAGVDIRYLNIRSEGGSATVGDTFLVQLISVRKLELIP